MTVGVRGASATEYRVFPKEHMRASARRPAAPDGGFFFAPTAHGRLPAQARRQRERPVSRAMPGFAEGGALPVKKRPARAEPARKS